MNREVARATVPRRAVQTTVAAAAGFYVFRYGLHQPVAALYSLFAPIALGPLSAIAGAGGQRAAVVVRALPVALLLVVLGTALAASTWAAVAGMLAVGFLLGFAPVGGPRSAGAAPGLQLFYILACFPPYAPDTLPERLAGAAVGTLLLAACEAFLVPGTPDRDYRERLADALGTAAEAVRGDVPVTRLLERGEGLRLSQVPPGERPTGPGRRDRALLQAGGATRRLLDGLAELPRPAPRAAVPLDGARPGPRGAEGTAQGARGDGTRAEPSGHTPCAAPRAPGGAGEPDPCHEVLLAEIGDVCAAASAALATGTGVPSPESLEGAARRAQAERDRRTRPPLRTDTAELRAQSAVLELAGAAWIAVTALGVAERGRAAAPRAEGDVFWYADLSAYRLWSRRVSGNLTRRSVWFQNAVRVSLGLALARLVAGTLDLAHGFWVLLAVLTLGRTTVRATWGAVRQAVLGNLVGAAAAGLLLGTLGQRTDVYAALLVPVMLVAFLLGPLWGIACAQALFTFLVALVFAQVAPVNWRLSEIRLEDVVTGSVIGLLCGCLAWPAGGHSEVRRTMADLLRACGELLPAVADLLTEPARAGAPPPTLPLLHRMRLAEAAYVQYCNEPPAVRDPAPTDWHAVLVLAHQALQGAHRLPRFDLPPPGSGRGADGTPPIRGRPAANSPEPDAPPRATGGGPDGARAIRTTPDRTVAQPVLVDLDAWLTGVSRQLDRITAAFTTSRP